ncbi:MAG: alpha/beta fold hydrolase [Gammaproteobacteria bacterium]|nr:alpha/beta fold hydrolase [Gammaproteobacteria bacterium]MDE2261809.1 alpha/beta fold hydrolase [Gammaproteobacteria bacterium]
MSRNPHALVLLPGLLCDRAVWEPQIAALSGRYDCIVADYGAADSLASMAKSALESAPSRFSLAGHSMGGRVALEILRNAPQRVARLALLDTGHQARPEGEAGEAEAAKRYRLLDIALSQGMRVMGREWLRGMVHPDRLQDEALIECILAMIARKTPGIFAAQIRALLDRPSAEPVMRAVRCRTLVLCGRQDGWSPLARHEEIARMITGARLAVIEDSGHMTTLERPQAVTAALEGWLAAAD